MAHFSQVQSLELETNLKGITILCPSESKHTVLMVLKPSKLITQIGKRIQEATGEKLSTFYLKQRISMAIQKGNAVCVRGCPKKTSTGLKGIFNFHVQEAEML